MKNTRTKIVAMIPSFNAETLIADVVLKTRKYVDEIIVIDDGSYDNTAKVAEEAGALVIRHGINLGKGAAMKTAVRSSDAEVIIFIDADGQHDPECIPQLLMPVLGNKADMVIGSRFLKGSKRQSEPWQRRLANCIASFVISVITSFLVPASSFIFGSRLRKATQPDSRMPWQTESSSPRGLEARYRLATGRMKWITDAACGFRAITKESWEKLDLVSDRYQVEAEMIYEAVKNGLTIAEMPVSCTWEGKISGLSAAKDGFSTLFLLLRKTFPISPNLRRHPKAPAPSLKTTGGPYQPVRKLEECPGHGMKPTWV